MLMEPLAGDATEDNLGPVGRVAYAFSTMACVPVSLSTRGGYGAGRPGRTRETDRSNQGRRLQSGPARRRDATQYDSRSAALNLFNDHRNTQCQSKIHSLMTASGTTGGRSGTSQLILARLENWIN